MVPLRNNDRELSVALMVSLSNHEGVALSHPHPAVIPAQAGIQGPKHRPVNPTLVSRLRGNDTE